jgi:hypothetical protein
MAGARGCRERGQRTPAPSGGQRAVELLLGEVQCGGGLIHREPPIHDGLHCTASMRVFSLIVSSIRASCYMAGALY